MFVRNLESAFIFAGKLRLLKLNQANFEQAKLYVKNEAFFDRIAVSTIKTVI